MKKLAETISEKRTMNITQSILKNELEAITDEVSKELANNDKLNQKMENEVLKMRKKKENNY
jgi:hypothetical protein